MRSNCRIMAEQQPARVGLKYFSKENRENPCFSLNTLLGPSTDMHPSPLLCGPPTTVTKMRKNSDGNTKCFIRADVIKIMTSLERTFCHYASRSQGCPHCPMVSSHFCSLPPSSKVYSPHTFYSARSPSRNWAPWLNSESSTLGAPSIALLGPDTGVLFYPAMLTEVSLFSVSEPTGWPPEIAPLFLFLWLLELYVLSL